MKNKVLTVLFFIAVISYFLSPISDIDFPWHLKTGEYIVKHHEIPKDDPFSFPGKGVIEKKERFILSQYWLAQVIYFGLYSMGGPLAMVILKVSLFLIFFFLIFLFLKEKSIFYTITFSVIAALILSAHRYDSPQHFSTVLSITLLFLLERFRRNPSSIKILFFIPMLMLLWANLHGGFVFGIAIIVIYTSAETIKYLLTRLGIRRFGEPLSAHHLLPLLLCSLIAILISYVNPNGYSALQRVTGSYSTEIKEYHKGIRGYMTPVQETRFPAANKISNISYWILLGYVSIIALFGPLRKKYIEITSLSLIAFSIFTSLSAMRFTPFFIAISATFVRDYSFFKKYDFLQKNRNSKLTYTIFLVFLIAVIGIQIKSKKNLSVITETYIYPLRTANFLSENHINARMFNSYNKGGYLLWRLYPKYRVFYDTRSLNMKIIKDGDSIRNARNYSNELTYYALVNALTNLLPQKTKNWKLSIEGFNKYEGTPYWKKLLDHYKIDLIVHEACDFMSGQVYPLTLQLIKDEEWSLIYLDGNVLIFLRDKPEYKEIIKKYKKPKDFVFTEILLETTSSVRKRVPSSGFYSSLGLALIMQDKIEDAEKMIEAALAINKNDGLAKFCDAYLSLKKKLEANSGQS